MRISTNAFLGAPLAGMLNREASIAALQEKISTGKDFYLASEEPFKASRALTLQQSQDITERYSQNIGLVSDKMAHNENTLSSMGEILNNIRVRVIQANTGSMGSVDREIIASEIGENITALVGLANTTDTNGEYIYSGFSVRDKPYEELGGVYNYNGDNGVRDVRVGPNLKVESNIPGNDVFNIRTADAGTVDNVFNVLTSFNNLLKDNTVTSIDFENALTDIDSALQNITFSVTKIGSKMNSMRTQEDINSSFLLRISSEKQQIEELDFTSAITRLNSESIALQASQKAYSSLTKMSLFNYL